MAIIMGTHAGPAACPILATTLHAVFNTRAQTIALYINLMRIKHKVDQR